MVRLSEIDGVVAFKESSRDISKIGRLIQEIDASGNARYFTTMQPLLATLQLGGAGAMMPPPATLIGRAVADAYAAGDMSAAERWQRQFTLFPARWSSHGLSPVMRAAMRHLGVDLGAPAAPFSPLSEAEAQAVTEFLDAAGVPDLAGRPAAATG